MQVIISSKKKNFSIFWVKANILIKGLISGVIINTSGWIKEEGFKSLVHTAMEFDVTTILVLDQERLQERLRVELKNDLPDVKILSLPKSGGVNYNQN